jgi:stage V sporulation protein SpoVS
VIFAQVYPDSTTATAVSPEQIAAALNGAYGVSNAKPVSGIGDKAVEYTLTGAQAGTVIFVFKSNVVLVIVVTPAPSSTAIEGLARTAAGRLKPA